MDELRPYKAIKFNALGEVRCYFWLNDLKRVCADALIYDTGEPGRHLNVFSSIFFLSKQKDFILLVWSYLTPGSSLLLPYDIEYDYNKIIKTLQKSWKA